MRSSAVSAAARRLVATWLAIATVMPRDGSSQTAVSPSPAPSAPLAAPSAPPPPPADVPNAAPTSPLTLPPVYYAPYPTQPWGYAPYQRPRLRAVQPGGRGRRLDRASTALLYSGVGTFGAAWIASVIGWVAMSGCSGILFGCGSTTPFLIVPIAGPWLALAENTLSPDRRAFVAIDGVAQAISVGLMIVAAARARRVIYDFGSRRARGELHAMPLPFTSDGVGLSIAGSFL